MFFRRQKERELTYSDHVDALQRAGFTVRDLGGGKKEVTRGGITGVIRDEGSKVHVDTYGIRIGNEIGELTHGGYQMFFRTPGGKKEAALAEDLRSLHAFREDMTEALGEESYYNTSLGSICDHHQYDRVEDRDTRKRVPVWAKTSA